MVTEDTYTVDQIFDGTRTGLENMNGNIAVVQNTNVNSRSATVVVLNTTANGANTTNYVPNTNETAPVLAVLNTTTNEGNTSSYVPTTNETTTSVTFAPNSASATSGVSASLDGVPRSAIVKADIVTQDGIVHVMDTFLVAPYIGLNMIGLLLDDTSEKFEFSTMAHLAIFAGLRDVIDMVYDNGVTFLVPPNRRFIRGEFDVPALFTEASREYTHSLVISHLILHTNYYESSVYSLHEENNILETLEVSYLGTSMWITTTDDRLRFQGVDILLPVKCHEMGTSFATVRQDTKKGTLCICYKTPLTVGFLESLSFLCLPPILFPTTNIQSLSYNGRGPQANLLFFHVLLYWSHNPVRYDGYERTLQERWFDE
jgi:hypothetical protein